MSVNTIQNLREQYAALTKVLLAIGDREQAYACAEIAVKYGIWKDVRQRPSTFNPALPQKTIYDAAGLWFVPYLESHYPIIRDEVIHVADPSREGFSPVEEPLVGKGRWEEVIFYEGGIRMDRSCSLFPKTAEIMSRIPEAIHSGGVVMLSWLYPKTHIVPHCGESNLKLRVHMGLKIPSGASMRVGDEHFVWQEGRCTVFDDSFEHEVWNRSNEPRIILLFDIVHPELSPRDMKQKLYDETNLEETIRKFLIARSIAEIERDPITDKLTVTPDRATMITITRYMKDHDVTHVGIVHGAVVID
jgi:aspartate beta-hydroxylase